MAPMTGPSRAALIRKLRAGTVEGSLPITLGRYSPEAIVRRESDGTFTLRPLVLDDKRARAAGEAALAKGDNWMPEHEWQFLEPAAPIVEAKTIDELIERIETIKWTFGGRDDWK